MSDYSVADAKNNLSKLIDRALAGEAVTITRHGQPVAELRSISSAPRAVTADDIAWLRARRVGRRSKEDAGAYVSRMRDEDWR